VTFSSAELIDILGHPFLTGIEDAPTRFVAGEQHARPPIDEQILRGDTITHAHWDCLNFSTRALDLLKIAFGQFAEDPADEELLRTTVLNLRRYLQCLAVKEGGDDEWLIVSPCLKHRRIAYTTDGRP